jgi:signal transduction histidine kinase
VDAHGAVGRRRGAGWCLVGLTAVLVATVPWSLAGGVASRAGVAPDVATSLWMGGAVVGGFVVAGATLVHLRPHNLLGWLLAVTGLLQAVSSAGTAYGVRALTDPDGSLPLGRLATWLGSSAFVPALLLPVLVMPALYPTGRPPSRLWSWHVRLSLTGILLMTVAAATVDEVTNEPVAGSGLPWDAPQWWAWAIVGGGSGLLIGALGVVVIGTLVRVVRARAPERQQLLWLVCVVGVMMATLLLPATERPFMLAFACIPLAVLVGVLRYRLLGIEVVLRRTLLYAPLAVLVALTIGAMTAGLARVVPEGPLPLLGASAVVAILVIPVAGRLRLLVDRLVLGRRADPLDVVDQVGAEMTSASEDPVASMLKAVSAAVGTTHAAVHAAEGRELARVGDPCTTGMFDVPLRHGGAVLGVLSVGPRRGEARVSVADARLVRALAPHLAVVVSSGQLTEELAQQRTRVAAAALVERDRLRRDLHDGLGPSLSGIALGLEAAGAALERDPARVAALLERTRGEADAAVREIRRVLDGLRPAALDRGSLEGALREAAEHLGMGGPGKPSIDLHVEGSTSLPPQVEECAFRIVAEAMTNVARHSGADHCDVRVSTVDRTLQIGVVDDGSGLAGSGSTGHGLDSMRRRAADAGGRLTIAGLDPRGTAVTASLPIGTSS